MLTILSPHNIYEEHESKYIRQKYTMCTKVIYKTTYMDSRNKSTLQEICYLEIAWLGFNLKKAEKYDL
jgi:hypothetical protein